MGATVANAQVVKFSDVRVGQPFYAFRGNHIERYRKFDEKGNAVDCFTKNRVFNLDDEVFVD